jgi:hypothetical protein
MPIAVRLPVRTWAALDAALGFFREAPGAVAAARPLARHCRALHDALRTAGVRWQYVRISQSADGRPLFRLYVGGPYPVGHPLTLSLSPAATRALARLCLTVIEVQTDVQNGPLLDHEAEELQAARAFLTELRRQTDRAALIPLGRGRPPVCWHEQVREYDFTGRAARRMHQHYLRAGACLN